MHWITRFAVLSFFLLAPAFGDNIVDITGNNIGISPFASLNFSFEFDATTKTVVGTPTFTCTGSQCGGAFNFSFNFTRLIFDSAGSGPNLLVFKAPPLQGEGSTTLEIGDLGFVPEPPNSSNFPSVGTYSGLLVGLDGGIEGGSGTITVTQVATPEPSVGLLLLLGLGFSLGITALPFRRT